MEIKPLRMADQPERSGTAGCAEKKASNYNGKRTQGLSVPFHGLLAQAMQVVEAVHN
jgi:hypothetical protein